MMAARLLENLWFAVIMFSLNYSKSVISVKVPPFNTVLSLNLHIHYSQEGVGGINWGFTS
jgi:hypothetical protein